MKRVTTMAVIAMMLLMACSSGKNTKSGNEVNNTLARQTGDTVLGLSKPPAELVGRWKFEKLAGLTGNTTFTKEFLVFGASEMRVNGKASCNGFFGNYTADTSGSKKEIHFEAIGHTMMACENLATENKMLAAMEKVRAWSRVGDKLYLKAGSTTLIELTHIADGII